VTATETSCTACHLSRTDRAQNDCAACHATVPPALATAHSRVRGFSATNSAGCKECHADADVFRLSAHRAFDPRHEGARCNQCHQRRRTDKPWAINFTGPTNCVGCHHNAGCSYTNQGPCD
jgi:predicted CXXCH cytochrome family protein